MFNKIKRTIAQKYLKKEKLLNIFFLISYIQHLFNKKIVLNL